MKHHARADDVRIESDEQGFELHVDTEDGDTFVFQVQHLAWDLAGQADRTICAWRREGENALQEPRPNFHEDDLRGYGLDFGISGYDRSDPKHPEWHSVHAGIIEKETA